MSNELSTEVVRCRGCGSVVNGRACRPIDVDTTQPGYRYLADTWGYCLTLSRHIARTETPWLRSVVQRVAEGFGCHCEPGSCFGADENGDDGTCRACLSLDPEMGCPVADYPPVSGGDA